MLTFPIWVCDFPLSARVFLICAKMTTFGFTSNTKLSKTRKQITLYDEKTFL